MLEVIVVLVITLLGVVFISIPAKKQFHKQVILDAMIEQENDNAYHEVCGSRDMYVNIAKQAIDQRNDTDSENDRLQKLLHTTEPESLGASWANFPKATEIRKAVPKSLVTRLAGGTVGDKILLNAAMNNHTYAQYLEWWRVAKASDASIEEPITSTGYYRVKPKVMQIVDESFS
jgi:hypothetical protein